MLLFISVMISLKKMGVVFGEFSLLFILTGDSMLSMTTISQMIMRKVIL